MNGFKPNFHIDKMILFPKTVNTSFYENSFVTFVILPLIGE